MLPALAAEPDERFASRYSVRRLVGAGGSATVHEAFDEAAGTLLALKRLRPEALRRPNIALLFRREYRTLKELSHPLIVRAYEFGVDDGVPYYTMELVSGSDLRALSPLGWREACLLLRDVASALALLHSRRLVHRDVTAANVFRTDEGRGKLLDFGALCPMGVAHEVLGTGPFVSPENLDGRPLDARSDLFSLGALAYFLVTGTHAYPASRLSDLQRVWARAVEPPSASVAEIPAELDALVLSLLSLNPLGRPASASEVMERLSTVAGLEPSECPAVALSYVIAPSLVGRDEPVARFRRRILRADRGRGSSLVIEGKPGFGRSRLLGGLLTEAKLSGMRTLYADGAEGKKGAFGVARALGRRLLEVDPLRAREALPDPRLLEELGLVDSETGFRPVLPEWRTLVDGIVGWFTRVSLGVSLGIAVDDLDQADEPSAAVIAKLAEQAPSRRLIVLATARTGAVSRTTERIRSMGGSYALQALNAEETSKLTASMFGEVPHVAKTAAWLHGLSKGSPQVIVELAQHLVDRGVARYEQGAWVLPATLTGLDLPKNIDDAILARIGELGPFARTLAEGLSLAVAGESLRLEEYAILLGVPGAEELFPALNELIAASILVGNGSSYCFCHERIRLALAKEIPDERRTDLHLRLAELYGARPVQERVIGAHHLLLAGREREAFSLVVEFVHDRNEYFGKSYRFLRTQEAASLFERLFEWGRRERATKAELIPVARTLLGLASVGFGGLARHAPWIMAELERDTGLVHWDEFANISDPEERIRACVARAAERAAALPEKERGLDPVSALREFSNACAMLAGVYAQANQPERAAELLPSLNKLRPLSPAIDIVAGVVQYSSQARRGWIASDIRRRVIAQVAEPVPGLDETTRLGVGMHATYYQGLEEALTGNPMAAERARQLESHVPFAAFAWQIRTVAHLFQGEEKQAEVCRKKRELALIGHIEADGHVEMSITYELIALVILGDLIAVKRTIPMLRERAASRPGWMAFLVLAEGAHAWLKGDVKAALALSEQALELCPKAAHVAYALAVVRCCFLLIQTGRAEDAAERARSALEACRGVPIFPPFIDILEIALASAEARLGDGAGALERAGAAVRRAEERNTGGILMMELYALQAHLALHLKDQATFSHASKRVGELCAKVDSKSFTARLSSLLQESLGAGFEPLDPEIRKFRSREATAITKIRTELELCRGVEERAQRVLAMILRQSGAPRGFLYLSREDGLTLAAARSVEPPPMQAEEWLLRWLETFRGAHDSEATTGGGTTFFSERFAVVALVSEGERGASVPAFAVLDCEGCDPRLVPETTLREMAEVLLDAGDAPRR